MEKMWINIVLLFIAVLNDAVAQDQADNCGVGWEEFDGSCFFPGVTSLSWYDARDDCQQRGGDLAVITNKETNVFIKSVRSSANHNWIGLHDPRVDLVPYEERRFEWVDGATPSYYGYSNWKETQPNNEVGDEDCVAFVQTGKWVDKPCRYIKLYICQRPTTTVTPCNNATDAPPYDTDAPYYETDVPPYATETPSYGCGPGQWMCFYTRDCISEGQRCDGNNDCPSWEDEVNCMDGEYFHCSGGPDIPQRWTCDRFQDCPHGDDEQNCLQ